MTDIQPQEVNPNPQDAAPQEISESGEINETGENESVGTEEPQTKQTVWQIVKFTLFSASAGIIQFTSTALLLEVFRSPYWLAYGIGLVLSVLWNFTLNRRYTFRSDMDVPKAMTLVFLYYLVFAPLSDWLGHLLTDGGANEYLVLIGTMLVNFITEYLYQRFVVYRKTIDTNEMAQRAKAKSQA